MAMHGGEGRDRALKVSAHLAMLAARITDSPNLVRMKTSKETVAARAYTSAVAAAASRRLKVPTLPSGHQIRMAKGRYGAEL